MCNDKRLVMLDVAFDLVSKVHSDLCRENNGVSNETLGILQSIYKVSAKLEKKENSANERR